MTIGLHTDDQGREVMRAIIHFYDGAFPDVTYKSVWNREPVFLVDADKYKLGSDTADQIRRLRESRDYWRAVALQVDEDVQSNDDDLPTADDVRGILSEKA